MPWDLEIDNILSTSGTFGFTNWTTLQGNVTKFNLCFIRYRMNFNKFTMVKMANPLVNKD